MPTFAQFFSNIVHVQAVGSVILLVGFLVATTVLQQRVVRQTVKALDTASNKVKQTALWESAKRYFERREVDNVFTSPTHVIPVYFLVILVGFCSIVTYFGAELFASPTLAAAASYVLGGAYASRPDIDTAKLWDYQSGTVFVGSMAFLSAYLWTIARLVNRINNDDMSAVTYYFLSIRILTACISLESPATF